MPPDSLQSPQSQPSQIAVIYRTYAALSATLPLDAQSGLGGKLLYAGEIGGAGLDSGLDSGRDLLFAANISGAASLAASADPIVQRQAIRDGVVDFVVNSLEEALRILKNEIRKRQAVSVGVAVDPGLLVAQMLDRGVLPDLLPPSSEPEHGQLGQFLVDGAVQIVRPDLSQPDLSQPDEKRAFITWSVDREFSRWLPRLDACVLRLLPGGDLVRERWVRLAPRYLGRLVQREHGVALDEAEAATLREEALKLLAEHSKDEGGVPKIEIGRQRVA
jgi:Urocanase Rossmann-like domain